MRLMLDWTLDIEVGEEIYREKKVISIKGEGAQK